LFDGDVVIQEKIDGSQVSFALEYVGIVDGRIVADHIPVVRSKNQVVQDGNKMFQMTLDWVRGAAAAGLLNPDYIYRGECVSSLKHNTLTYERVPNGGVVLFDIYDRVNDKMLDPQSLFAESERIGLESVQCLVDYGTADTEACLHMLEDATPTLGGERIEGVVIKRYDLPGPQAFGHTTDAQGFLKVKLVSNDFKELHHKDWKGRNPNGKDLIANLIEVYGTPQRFAKSVQHLREEGKLVDEPKDIGLLIPAVIEDIIAECGDDIAKAIAKHYGKQVYNGISKKVPSYYKEEVLGIVA